MTTRFNVFATWPKTNSWGGKHLAVDYGTPIGTVVRAPQAGTYRRLPTESSKTDPTSAGVWGELVLSDGSRIRFCHLSKHIAAHNSKVVKGQALARTGNTGFVIPSPTWFNPNAGAHMHTYGLTRYGARWNWTVGATKGCYGVVIPAKGLNLRANHSTKSKVLLTIPENTKLTARGFYRKWWKVTYKNKTGWIHAGYVR